MSDEWTGRLPVTEAESILAFDSAEVDDYSCDDEADDEHDLEGSEDDFALLIYVSFHGWISMGEKLSAYLAVCFDRTKVQNHDQDDEDCEEDGRVDIAFPIIDERRCRADLSGSCDSHRIP